MADQRRLVCQQDSSGVVGLEGNTKADSTVSASDGSAGDVRRCSFESDNVVVEACAKETRLVGSSETLPVLDFLCEAMLSADKKEREFDELEYGGKGDENEGWKRWLIGSIVPLFSC